MKIELINVGRHNVNKIVEVKNENYIRKEVGKYLLSRGWDLHETKEPKTYDVVAGFRTVGQVKILED